MALKKWIYVCTLSAYLPIQSNAQVGINTDQPSASLELHLNSTNTKSLRIISSANKNVLEITRDGLVGLGVADPIISLDIRDGDDAAIGIGTSTATAADAGSGALKYDTYEKKLYMSTGNIWKEISSRESPVYIVAKIPANNNIAFPSGSTVSINSWQITNSNSNTMNGGIFSVPRNGYYTISCTLGFNPGLVTAGSYIQLNLNVNPLNNIELKSRSVIYRDANVGVFTTFSNTVYLTKDQTVNVSLYHNLGSSKTLNRDYCSLTIVES